MKKFTAFLLALLISVSGFYVPAWAKSDRLTNYDHEVVDFQSIKYEHYDITELEEKIKSLEELMVDEKNIDEIKDIVLYIEDELYVLQENFYLANYHQQKAPDDKYWSEEKLYCNENFTRLLNLYQRNMQKVSKSPCIDALRAVYSDEDIQYIMSRKIPSDEQIAISDKREKVLAGWYEIKDETEFEGKKYDFDSAAEAYYAGEISYQQYAKIWTAIRQNKILKSAEIYLKIIDLDNELARSYGYDNYLELAYKDYYERDFTPQEAKEVYGELCEKLKPLFVNLVNAYKYGWLENKSQETFSGDIVAILGKYMEKLAPEFKESFDYMKKTNSLVTVPGNEAVTSFTSSLAKYNMPFICLNIYPQNVDTMLTLVHEFGHYNALYWRDNSEVGMSLDLEEVYSHTMELFFMNFFKEMYDEGGTGEERHQVGVMIDEVFYTSVCALLEIEAYYGEYKTPEELAEKLTTLGDSYFADAGYMSTWYDMSQLFETPGYVLSYTISSLSAFELYVLSKEDPDEALDRYIKLIGNAGLSLKDAFSKAGLTYKWTKKKIDEMIDKIYSYFVDTEVPVIHGAEDGKVYDDTVSIRVSDDSGVFISLMNNGLEMYANYGREFEVGGANGEYILNVRDYFGNETTMSFEVEPSPFTVNAKEGKDGSVKLSWDKVANAKYYKIYGAPLGEKFKKLGKVDAATTDFKVESHDDRIWKYRVVAYGTSEGKNYRMCKSYNTYVAGSGNSKYTNVKSIDITDGETLNLKKKESCTIIVKEVLSDKKKVQHSGKKVKAVRYDSMNESVATVSKTGEITAVGKGECYIYAIAENGLSDRIKVKVG